MSAPNSTIDHYAVLEVAQTASPEVIEAAYRGLMAKYGASPAPEIRALREHVETAYQVLGDTARRAEYDAARKGSAASVVAAPVIAAPAAEPAPPAFRPATIVECPRDPGVETALRCGRCDTPICPKCLIQSPVGSRCRDCGRLSKNPIYTLTTQGKMRAAAAAGIGGIVMGFVWGLVLIQFTFGIFSIFLGLGLGWVFTRALDFATGRKRGPMVAGFAIGGIFLAWGVMALMVPGIALFGLVPAGIGSYMAYQNLRAF